MNPCSRYRSRLALLAAGVLPEAEAQPLRDHCEQCSGCASHLRTLSAICSEHQAAAQTLSSAQSDAGQGALGFHQRWRQRLRHEIQSVPAPAQKPPSWLSGIPWPRFALGFGGFVAASVAVVLLVSGTFRTRPPVIEPTAASSRSIPKRAPAESLAERPDSLRAYRLAMNNSATAFDALLTQNAARPMPTESMVRAFQRDLENGID